MEIPAQVFYSSENEFLHKRRNRCFLNVEDRNGLPCKFLKKLYFRQNKYFFFLNNVLPDRPL